MKALSPPTRKKKKKKKRPEKKGKKKLETRVSFRLQFLSSAICLVDFSAHGNDKLKGLMKYEIGQLQHTALSNSLPKQSSLLVGTVCRLLLTEQKSWKRFFFFALFCFCINLALWIQPFRWICRISSGNWDGLPNFFLLMTKVRVWSREYRALKSPTNPSHPILYMQDTKMQDT